MFTILLVLGKNMHNVEKLIKKVRSFAHPSLTRKEGFHENSGSQEQVIFFPHLFKWFSYYASRNRKNINLSAFYTLLWMN